jgi:hypothetical protein
MTSRRAQLERAARVRAAIASTLLNATGPLTAAELYALLPAKLAVTHAELDNKLYQGKQAGLFSAQRTNGRLAYSPGTGAPKLPKPPKPPKPSKSAHDRMTLLFRTSSGGVAAMSLLEARAFYDQLHSIFGRRS